MYSSLSVHLLITSISLSLSSLHLVENLVDGLAYIPYQQELSYPFIQVIKFIANIKVDIVAIDVTCKGAQAPSELCLNCLILLVCSYLIASDYNIMMNLYLGFRIKHSGRLLSMYGASIGRNHWPLIFFSLAITAALSLDPFRLLLQWGMGALQVI